jgi:hypothetical protein
MTRHRTIVCTLVLLVALSAGMPASALANSLLSGYGGPGGGDQAILGSALLNGPRGGGGARRGGGQGAGGSSLSAQSSAGGQVGSSASTAVTSPPARTRAATARGHGKQPLGVGGQASGSASYAYTAASRGEARPPAPGNSETLGLSREDVLYILLVLGALAFAGVLTRRLTRTPPGRKARSG